MLFNRIRFPESGMATIGQPEPNPTRPMSIYNSDWQDVPGGYYADPVVKSNHDQKVRDERRFNRLVENELGKMGYDRHEPEIPTAEDIETAEERARSKF